MIRIRQTILARSIRRVNAIYSLEYRPELFARLRDRYSFLKVPTTADEILGTDPQVGIRFQHGKFVQDSKSFVVEQLQFLIVPPGVTAIICDTHTSTDDSDLFIDDYIRQANLPRPDTITVSEPPLYVSQLEFTMEQSLADLCHSPVRAATETVDRWLITYGVKMTPFEPSSIAMICDPFEVGEPLASPFTIERRAGFRYGSNVFFSQAPLRTRDHIEVLEHLTAAR